MLDDDLPGSVFVSDLDDFVLSTVPDSLWAQTKYDVGLIVDCEPVFKALLEKSVIVPSDGSPITYHKLVSDLLEAILLPSAVAVCKCAAHSTSFDPVSAGNVRADAATKAVAASSTNNSRFLSGAAQSPELFDTSLSAVQSLASPQDVKQWSSSGCIRSSDGWFGPDGKPCLPSALFPHYAKLTHGLDHVSKGGMYTAINQYWFTKDFTAYAQKCCEKCLICLQNNPGKAIKPAQQAAHPPPDKPFDHIMIDFIELTPSEGKKYCLVIVDMF